MEWVQCDKCRKWRSLKPEDFNRAVQQDTWYCHQNPDDSQASCEVPQSLTDAEIDEIYKKREIERAKSMSPVLWQEIQANVYTYKRRRTLREDDIAICQCQSIGGKGCLENCINRMLNIECTKAICGLSMLPDPAFRDTVTVGIPVLTRDFLEDNIHKWKLAGLKGFGLFSAASISEGDFVTEYMGEVVDEAEYSRRRIFYADKGHKHFYFMQIGNGEVIDACRMGNAGRFMNHSCEPNCETQKWVVKGDLRVGFFALKNIRAGEELTFNYNFQTEKPIKCCCGSEKCSGTIGGQKTVIESALNEESLLEVALAVPDPIMLKEEEVDDIVKVILQRQVGIKEDGACSSEQIRSRLRELYLSRGRTELVQNLEAQSISYSGSRLSYPKETSSGDSCERVREGPSHSSARRKSRGRGRGALDRRLSKLVVKKAEPEIRYSEIYSSLADISASSGKLYNPSRRTILKVLRLFNLIEIGMTEKELQEAALDEEKKEKSREEMVRSGQIYLGTALRAPTKHQPVRVAGYCVNEISPYDGKRTPRQQAHITDLCLLLNVVQNTVDPVARSLFIECGILSQLQQVIGRNFGPQFNVILRKILKVVDCLPLCKPDFQKTRCAHGTMENLITALAHHKDNGVRSTALSIARIHGLECEAREASHNAEVNSTNSSQGREQRDKSAGISSTARHPSSDCGYRQLQLADTGSMQTCSHDLRDSQFYPPPPPPATEKICQQPTISSASLPPGFGYAKASENSYSSSSPSRERNLGSGEGDKILISHSTVIESRFGEIEMNGPECKYRSLRQRLIRKIHGVSVPEKEGLFSNELGKLDYISESARQECLAREEKEEEERHKRQRLSESSTVEEPEGWDHLNSDFQTFVRSTLRQRIQKYQQPDHPLNLSSSEAETLFKKLYVSIIESEDNAFKMFARDRIRRHVSKAKLALNIKDYTRRTMHDYYASKSHQI